MCCVALHLFLLRRYVKASSRNTQKHLMNLSDFNLIIAKTMYIKCTLISFT